MYCVKCGVRLQETVQQCPLCNTPTWHPQTTEQSANRYPERYPMQEPSKRIPVLAFITVGLIAVCLACLIYCLRTYGRVNWSGYVMLGIATVYLSVLLPQWFEHSHPLIFVPVGFFSVCGYLLYICLYSGGRWFLSFAFPAVMIACVITTATLAMFRYVKRAKLFTVGGLLVAIGGSTMLLEMFEHITFGTKMFTWSLYSVSAFGAFGLFIILAGFIRPLREFLQRKLFL